MINFRIAVENDWKNIAALHALSWQVNYRGSMTDDYLDNRVIEERASYWKKLYDAPPKNMTTIIAEENNDLLGFSCLYFNADPTYGTYLDNLHVQPHLRKRGIGKKLMAKSAEVMLEKNLAQSLYLWVIVKNIEAIKFYDRIEGAQEDIHKWDMPDGGKVDTYRYVWYDIEKLSKLS